MSSVVKRETCFRKCKFCKVALISDKAPSGYQSHAHDYWQIWYVARGKCEHYVGDQVYNLNVGDSFLIPAGVTHKTLLLKDTSVICCDFAPEAVFGEDHAPQSAEGERSAEKVLCFLQNINGQLPLVRFQQNTRRRVEQLMKDLLDEYEQGDHYYEDVLRLKIRELIFLLMREFVSATDDTQINQIYEKYKTLMSEAIRYIDENYYEDISLSDVCKRFAISKTYFCHLFKLMTAQTFAEYLTKQRIEAAMILLEDQSQSISEISEKLGFSNSSYFSKIFKKHTGSLPKEYRKKHGNSGTQR